MNNNQALVANVDILTNGRRIEDHDYCNCGCGQPVAKIGSTYKPGHDARHISQLLQHYASCEKGDRQHEAIMDTLQGMSNALEAKFWAAVDRRRIQAEMRAAGATTRSANKMAKASKKTRTYGSIKVGRWEYPTVTESDGSIYRNMKRDGSGTWVGVAI